MHPPQGIFMLHACSGGRVGGVDGPHARICWKRICMWAGQNELCDAIAHRFARNSEASAPSVYWSALAAFMAALVNMADTE